MRIITKKRIHEFERDHADGSVAAREWYLKCSRANWTSFAEMKKTFNSADYVGNDRYVFNLAGNKYRLIAIVRFNIQKVFIRFIGPHKAYDEIQNIKNI